jgi:subtilisin-like proprotein convertase family protein
MSRSSMQSVVTAVVGACLSAILLIAPVVPAHAAVQTIDVEAGWNLISFAVAPADPSPSAVLAPLIAANNLDALWAYDAQTGTWSSFLAQPAPGSLEISSVQTGRGYWLKVERAGSFEVVGDGLLAASGPGELAQEWNLVGFPLDEPETYERVINDAAVRQIWTFDAAAGEFVGVVIDEGGLVVREDFVDLEPGRGYWLFANEAVSLAPVLATGLPPDLDLEPFLPNVSTRVAVPFTEFTPGDVDIGQDGFYDRAASQRAIDLGERLDIQPISIFSRGAGLMHWRIAVDDPDHTEWLRFRVLDHETRLQTLLTELEGSTTSETDTVDLVVDRTGLAPGEYRGTVSLTSNGADLSPPDEPTREIKVKMTVADLDGDYDIQAHIDTVDDKPADLPDPRLIVSLYRDDSGLKAVVDEAATLLFSERVRLSGTFVETGTSRFEVSGSYAMDADHPGNPWGEPVRRDLTLRGERRDPLNPDHAILGPLDLTGEYFETIRIRGATAEPIYLTGTFIGRRTGAIASLRDEITGDEIGPYMIPDDGVIQREIDVTKKVLITELDVTVNLEHTRPSDLVVTLIAPDGRDAVLRDRSGTRVGRVQYDEEATPKDSLAVFNGIPSPGTWKLRVADVVPGVTGTLNSWSLRIRGTEVHDLSGTVQAPAGTTVVLTGCGVTSVATTDSYGRFTFSDLVDCVYQITILGSGIRSYSMTQVVAGADVSDITIMATPVPPWVPTPVVLPSSDDARFTSMTTAGGAGALFPGTQMNGYRLQYALDTATFDVDRPPLEGFPGEEDTDAFGATEDPLTHSNAYLQDGNGLLDGPVGSQSRRMWVAIGLPVIGASVQGDLTLSIGANP